MENTTAVYTSFFPASLNIWNISTSHSLISSSVNRCFQFHLYHRVIKQILFFIFPNSCIAAVYLLLMSQLSQLPRTLRGIHLYWGSRQHTITSASRYQITWDFFFPKTSWTSFAWDELLHSFPGWYPAGYFPLAFPLFLQILFIFYWRTFVKIRQI